MARVKIYGIVEHLSSQMRRALRNTIDNLLPSAEYDEYELFREFKRAVNRKCNTWERVPDRYVEKDELENNF